MDRGADPRRGGGGGEPAGHLPPPKAIDLSGLDLPRERLAQALRWDAGEWLEALRDLGTFFESFGARLPKAIRDEYTRIVRRLGG